MKGKLYQLLDSSSEQMGLVYTEDPKLEDEDLFERLWEKWYTGEDYTGYVDDFIEVLEEEGYDAERVFSVDINP